MGITCVRYELLYSQVYYIFYNIYSYNYNNDNNSAPSCTGPGRHYAHVFG